MRARLIGVMDFLKAEIARWGKVIREAKVTVEG